MLDDLNMPDMGGIDLLRQLRHFDLDVPVVIVTGAPSLETAVKALEFGAFRYVTKPVLSEELARLVERAVRIHEMVRLRRLAFGLMEQSGYALGDWGQQCSQHVHRQRHQRQPGTSRTWLSPWPRPFMK